MQKNSWCAIITSLLIAFTSWASAQQCQNLVTDGEGHISTALRCVGELEVRIDTLVNILDQTRATVEKQKQTIDALKKFPNAIPRDLVAAYLTEASVSDINRHCPPGWSPLEEARGRFIIGAGAPIHETFKYWILTWPRVGEEDEQEKLGLETYAPKSSGGVEKHVLSDHQMPTHLHFVFPHAGLSAGIDATHKTTGAQGGNTATYALTQPLTTTNPGHGLTSDAGSSTPHNNMPPYIALYFCKKD